MKTYDQRQLDRLLATLSVAERAAVYDDICDDGFIPDILTHNLDTDAVEFFDVNRHTYKVIPVKSGYLGLALISNKDDATVEVDTIGKNSIGIRIQLTATAAVNLASLLQTETMKHLSSVIHVQNDCRAIQVLIRPSISVFAFVDNQVDDLLATHTELLQLLDGYTDILNDMTCPTLSMGLFYHDIVSCGFAFQPSTIGVLQTKGFRFNVGVYPVI